MKPNLKVKLEKLSKHTILMLQIELEYLSQYLNDYHLKTDFLNAIIGLDIAYKLYDILQLKKENERQQYTLSLTVSQAAIVVKCANYNRKERDKYCVMKMQDLANQINQKLTSLI